MPACAGRRLQGDATARNCASRTGSRSNACARATACRGSSGRASRTRRSTTAEQHSNRPPRRRAAAFLQARAHIERARHWRSRAGTARPADGQRRRRGVRRRVCRPALGSERWSASVNVSSISVLICTYNRAAAAARNARGTARDARAGRVLGRDHRRRQQLDRRDGGRRRRVHRARALSRDPHSRAAAGQELRAECRPGRGDGRRARTHRRRRAAGRRLARPDRSTRSGRRT